jgi:hypothetical protein
MLVARAHKIAISVAFVLLAVWLLVGSLQPSPLPSQGQSTGEHGTEQNKGGIRESWGQRAVNDPTAFFTLWVAIFTAVLSVSTIGLLRATRRSTDIAERALTELERPYLFVLDYNWLLTKKAKADGFKCGLVYSVANGGKLPAFIKAVKVGIRFGESIPSLHDEPPVHDLLTAPLIGGGEQRHVIQAFTDEDGEPARECQIRGGTALIPSSAFNVDRVIAKISIEYDGPITTGHMTTACWEWHPVKYAFTQYGGPEHNQRT